MATGFSNFSTIIAIFVLFGIVRSTQWTGFEVEKYLRKLREVSLKTIQNDGGDLIDCVPAHLQPAFDHPKLRGKKPVEPPERPRGYVKVGEKNPWLGNESAPLCPEGTVAVRRVTEDVLRASSVERFGRKAASRGRPVSTTGTRHEHAIGYVVGERFFGAKASLNVWAPRVSSPSDFSLSQVWVISGSFGDDLNTIEAGWQVSPDLYGDAHPRFFTYWTSDSYQTTGCYNLLCSGFVQTTNKFAIGTAISPVSTYGGGQFDISLLIWKDPKKGHWWLELGDHLIVGYWPSELFSRLGQHATMLQFGGEVVNFPGGVAATEMGSGRFSTEGFRRSSYFRNLQVVDEDNSLVPTPALHLLADRPECYDIRGGVHPLWGTYFYYGGAGHNRLRCL